MELCDSAIWIESGKMVQQGDAVAVAKAYEKKVWELSENASRSATKDAQATRLESGDKLNHDKQGVDVSTSEGEPGVGPGDDEAGYQLRNSDLRFTKVVTLNENGDEQYAFKVGDQFRIRVYWEGNSPAEKIWAGVRIDGPKQIAVTGYSGWEYQQFLNDGKPLDGEGWYELKIPSLELGAGQYYISVGLSKYDVIQNKDSILAYIDRIAQFSVFRKSSHPFNYSYEPTFIFEES